MDEPVQVQISGLNKLVRALNKLDDEARDDFKAAGKAAATIVVGEAKRTVPYRTAVVLGGRFSAYWCRRCGYGIVVLQLPLLVGLPRLMLRSMCPAPTH